MLLKDEEILGLLKTGEWLAGFHNHKVYRGSVIAKAQLKKVVEWCDAPCLEHPKTDDSYGKPYTNCHSDCPECWQSLLKEIE